MQLMDSVADRKKTITVEAANKFGGDWEREKVQGAAKCYDNDCHSKYI